MNWKENGFILKFNKDSQIINLNWILKIIRKEKKRKSKDEKMRR
jgi:hypothetical protein